ncbi:Hypothetical protein D9617_18g032570 [Elsinoe fawcettii]|nr:Hypothetical protein D9617_18g032570 [Elsinoe fawcettii]
MVSKRSAQPASDAHPASDTQKRSYGVAAPNYPARTQSTSLALQDCRPPISHETVGSIIEATAMRYIAGIQKMAHSRRPCFSRPKPCPQRRGIPNDIFMLAQLPVYVLKSLGKTLSNPAGYEYAYTQGAADMKVVMQAAFRLSSADALFLHAVIFHLEFRKEAKAIDAPVESAANKEKGIVLQLAKMQDKPTKQDAQDK